MSLSARHELASHARVVYLRVDMDTCVLDGAMVWVGDGDAFPGHVVVRDGRIVSVGRGHYNGGELPVVNLEGLALSPGMIDLMVLGGFGYSILRNDVVDIARAYLRLGVTSCQFCSGTLSWEMMRQVVANIRRGRAYDAPDAAAILGLYLEGPFQHPQFTGASLVCNALPPTAENVTRLLNDFGDVVTMVNVSPGTEGDAAAVRQLRDAGFVVSMAHSAAVAERVIACIEQGTSVLGHVWDNNSGLTGDSGVQQPTLEEVALTDERVRYIHMICDGAHVHPIMMRLVHRCRGCEAICIVTDASPRAGCPDGPFTWDDGREFYKKGGAARTGSGGLMGSGLLLPDHFRNFVKFAGVPPAQAIRTVTLNPAASLGLSERIGLIAPGRRADLVAWDPSAVRVRRVWRSGCEIAGVSELAEVSV